MTKSRQKAVVAATIPGAFYLVSLGCHKNLVDSEVIAGKLTVAGHPLVFDPEAAEYYIINTCAFLPAARVEAAAEIERALEWKAAAPGRKVAVAGCLTEYSREVDQTKRFSGVDYWFGVNDLGKSDFFAATAAVASAPTEPAYLYDDTTPRLQFTLPHVAYLKIADGCDNRCTYCAIPRLRGRLRSRTQASVLSEARQLIANGVRELVIIAQDISAFGMDRPESGETLAALLRELRELDGDFVLRLLYTHPAHFTDELIDVLAEGGKVLPYVDMPLQHISPRIIGAMNRHVTAERIREVIAGLRAKVPDLTLRTTFIAGFPGETEAEFQELAEFARQTKFERMGVFPYSAEPGTAAALLPGQVDPAVAEERAAILTRSQQVRMRRRNRALVGSEMALLIDEVGRGYAWGRGAADAPEIDNAVLIERPGRLKPGDFCRVRIVGVSGFDLVGEVMKGSIA